MATFVELGPDDVLIVRFDGQPDEHQPEILDSVMEILGIRAVLVLRPEATLASLPADEVLRAVAGP
jgi:hypothetical protein